ncbi:unnamed protein product [Dicrocoelium dendriticum]|nr:unnamed protein product [Dicrocoelium dendriticum]
MDDSAKDMQNKKQILDVIEAAKMNANIWQTRLDISEQENRRLELQMKQISDENADMHTLLQQSARDSAVMRLLISENEEQKDKISILRQELFSLHQSRELEKKRLQAEYIKKLEKELSDTKVKLVNKDENSGKQLVHPTNEFANTVKQSYESLLLERKRANRVYHLAKRVLEQRSEVESFFLSALNHVRSEINKSQ